MKIVVTHHSPDWDAITSVWLIKRFLPAWYEAAVQFVPAGSRLRSSVLGSRLSDSSQSVIGLSDKQMTDELTSENGKPKTDNRNPIEKIGEDEVIHVDTGLGPLDHHQTASNAVCGASLTFDFVKRIQNSKFKIQNSHPEREKHREEALSRIVKIVVDIDHFGEMFWDNPTADYHEFSLLGVLEGLKLLKPDEDMYYMDVGMLLLDALLHNFENRIWAEKEIAEHGIKFKTKWGKGIGFETINDTVLALSQKMGYAVVVRKDSRKGYIRIKARPALKSQISNLKSQINTNNQNSNKEKLYAKRYTLNADIDLTLAYEKLKKMDPQATWFLHVSKKMLLNGTVKNPTMKPTTLSLDEIIKVLTSV